VSESHARNEFRIIKICLESQVQISPEVSEVEQTPRVVGHLLASKVGAWTEADLWWPGWVGALRGMGWTSRGSGLTAAEGGSDATCNKKHQL